MLKYFIFTIFAGLFLVKASLYNVNWDNSNFCYWMRHQVFIVNLNLVLIKAYLYEYIDRITEAATEVRMVAAQQ